MDLFLNQGRCRVCGHMFCCRKHQLEHERVEHDDYADWLDVLPALCRRCHRTVKNIHDMKGNCVRFNMKHTLLKSEVIFPVTQRRSNRKRVILGKAEDVDDERVECGSSSNIETTIVESRKKITALRRLRKQMSPIVLIDLNEIKNRDDIMNTVFSPQFNISQNILSGDAKSSTPLFEEKENYPVIAIFDKNDMSMYKTPPQAIQGASLVVVSALKKSTSSEGIMKGSSNSKTKNHNSRKVTFEVAQTPEIESMEMSVYSTPEVEVPIPDRRKSASADLREVTISFQKVENDKNARVELSVYGTLKPDNELMVESADADDYRDRDCVAVTELMRNVKSTVTGIPKMIFNACSWSARVIRKRKNEDTSPICQELREKQNRRMLKRRPISSHWINLSTTSLRRRPLAAYREIDHEP